MTLIEQDYLEPLLKYQKKVSFEEEEENSNQTEYSYLRLLPDMSEGLIGLCIGDIMGILLSLDINNILSVQQQQELKAFIETLLKTSKSSLSIFKLSILYLYKLNKKLRELSVLNEFRNKLSLNNFQSFEPIKKAKLLFVVILMVAFKYTEDHCYYISAWSKATGIPSITIHKLEVDILNILDHNLFVSKERFETFSNRIIQKINKLKIDLLQSVKISYASSNYSSSSEEETTNSCEGGLRCKNCTCKRKQISPVEETTGEVCQKKRKVKCDSISIPSLNEDETTVTTTPLETQPDNASVFYSLPTTLYDYYKNRTLNNGISLTTQPLTPPTPIPFTIPSNPTNAANTTTATTSHKSTSNLSMNSSHILQVDSMIIPSTPPTSQTSFFEDLEREEEIKKDKINGGVGVSSVGDERTNEDHDYDDEIDDDEEDEVESSDDEGEIEKEDEDGEENEIEIPKSQNLFKSSTMAFILNPDENKIQLDYGNKKPSKIQSKTIPYHYNHSHHRSHSHNHYLSPSHHKTNFAYDNLKKVNLLDKKNEKTRMTPSIVLPNTSPVGDVASVFPSLSILSQPSSSAEPSPIEDTKNKTKSIGLKSLLSNDYFKPATVNSMIISNSVDESPSPSAVPQNQVQDTVKSNFITIRNDDTTTSNDNENTIQTTNCPYIDHQYTLSNDDLTKQKLLLSIYNCYAMRNIRHYQI